MTILLSPAPFLAAVAAVPPAPAAAGPLVREEELEGDVSLDDVGMPELPPDVTDSVDLRPGEMGRAIRDGIPPPPSP